MSKQVGIKALEALRVAQDSLCSASAWVDRQDPQTEYHLAIDHALSILHQAEVQFHVMAADMLE